MQHTRKQWLVTTMSVQVSLSISLRHNYPIISINDQQCGKFSNSMRSYISLVRRLAPSHESSVHIILYADSADTEQQHSERDPQQRVQCHYLRVCSKRRRLMTLQWCWGRCTGITLCGHCWISGPVHPVPMLAEDGDAVPQDRPRP